MFSASVEPDLFIQRLKSFPLTLLDSVSVIETAFLTRVKSGIAQIIENILKMEANDPANYL